MKTIFCEQRSPEWYQARLGVPTASEFDKIITTKGEPSKQSLKYLYKLAGEKLSGSQEEGFQSQAMLRGIEVENEARSFYQFTTESNLVQVGFCLSDCGSYGASPDSLVNDDGLLEIKCPMASTHVGYLMNGELPTDYFQQVQGQLLVTGRKWCDFLSYYPGLKPLLVRVYPDKKFIKLLKEELSAFSLELNRVITKIK